MVLSAWVPFDLNESTNCEQNVILYNNAGNNV